MKVLKSRVCLFDFSLNILNSNTNAQVSSTIIKILIINDTSNFRKTGSRKNGREQKHVFLLSENTLQYLIARWKVIASGLRK